MKRKIRFLVLVLVLVMMSAGSVSAKSNTAAAAKKAKNPYTDVTKKTVSDNVFSAISYIKTHKGYSGVISGKKFYPKKRIVKGEFIKICQNIWGKKNVPITKDEKKSKVKKETASSKWVTSKLSQTYKKKTGKSAAWRNVPNKKVTREGASSYVMQVINSDKKMKPIK